MNRGIPPVLALFSLALVPFALLFSGCSYLEPVAEPTPPTVFEVGLSRLSGGDFAGAELAFTYQGEAFGKRLEPLAQSVGSDFMVDVDVTDESVTVVVPREMVKGCSSDGRPGRRSLRNMNWPG